MGPHQMATSHGARLADRPLPRLFRDHVDCLHRLVPAFRGRGALMAIAALLEALQALIPDRSSNLFAAFCGASGALGQRCLLSSSSEHGGGLPARRKLRNCFRARFFSSFILFPCSCNALAQRQCVSSSQGARPRGLTKQSQFSSATIYSGRSLVPVELCGDRVDGWVR